MKFNMRTILEILIIMLSKKGMKKYKRYTDTYELLRNDIALNEYDSKS